MEDYSQKAFYARFLGGFSLTFAGKELLLKANPLGKCMQMIFFLLKAGSSGCEKKELLSLVRPDEKNQERRMNNFRQQVYLMRRLIRNSRFPEGSYITFRGTRCYFTLDYPVYTDTEKLDALIAKIRSKPESYQKLQEEYQAYCEAYTGEFLPLLGGEEWVVMESAHYQKWYFDCMNKLCVRLKEQGEYESLLQLAVTASRLHPYDEWQVVQIDCLMALNRRREAEKVYEEAAELFYKDLGLTSLDRAMARYQERSKTYHLSRAMNRMKTELDEGEKEEGAYLCSYPSFVDFYHIRARLDETNHEQSLLLLCTLSGEQEEWREEEREEQMALFQKTVVKATRSEDVFTRYSPNQYLVLLTGAGQGREKQMLNRLKTMWKKAGGRAETEFSIGAVEGPERSGGREKKSAGDKGKDEEENPGEGGAGSQDEREGRRFFDHHLLAAENARGAEENMGKKETFIVHIISQENSTWQGQVTWVNREETTSFRSFLELVKLMDNAVSADEAAS